MKFLTNALREVVGVKVRKSRNKIFVDFDKTYWGFYSAIIEINKLLPVCESDIYLREVVIRIR